MKFRYNYNRNGLLFASYLLLHFCYIFVNVLFFYLHIHLFGLCNTSWIPIQLYIYLLYRSAFPYFSPPPHRPPSHDNATRELTAVRCLRFISIPHPSVSMMRVACVRRERSFVSSSPSSSPLLAYVFSYHISSFVCHSLRQLFVVSWLSPRVLAILKCFIKGLLCNVT